MSDRLDWPDYVVVALLFVVYSFIGVFYGFRSYFIAVWQYMRHGKTNEVGSKDVSVNADDIFLGNRKLNLLPILGSTLASFLSAVALMGNNSEVYLIGLAFFNIAFGYCIAFPVAAEIYAPVFYKLNVASSHEYLELRFCRVLRWLVTLVFCFQMVVYVAVVLYAPALALSTVTNLPMWASILSSGLLGTFYTALGGIKAVVWTDFLQTIVLFSGLILLMIFGCQKVNGFEQVWSIAGGGQRLNFWNFDPNPFVRNSTWTLAIGGAGMVLSIYATNQTQVQRYLCCKDLKTVRRAIHLQLPMNVVLLSVQVIIGLVTYAVFSNCDPKLSGEIDDYDQLFARLVMNLFSSIPAIRGLFLATIFAASLSTVSSGVNSIACVLIEDVFMDIYLTCYRGSALQQRTLAMIARLLAIVFGLLMIGLAFLLQFTPPGVLKTAFSIFGAIGGPILAVFTLGIICPFVNKWGGLTGFMSSLCIGLIMIIGALFNPMKPYGLPVGTTGCKPNDSMLAAMTTTAPSQDVFWFFNLSYLYLSPLCLIVCFVVATIVSVLTGMNSKSPVSHSLLACQAVWLYSKLPSCLPPQSAPTAITSLHDVKMAAMAHGINFLHTSDQEDGISNGESVLEYKL